MTVVREAIVLPLLFLTVALLGGLRVAHDVHFAPPPLGALVLALLLLATLVRGGALAPWRLMHAERSPLENTSGLVVLLALYGAAAQTFHLLIPDAGLLHAAFSVFFFVQLAATAAGRTDRVGLLRTLTVLLGSAFILRWIVLEALYAPDGGTLKRVLTVLAEGVTLGGVQYAPHASINGYLAFVAVGLFLAGLALLPGRSGVHLARLGPDRVALPPVVLLLPLLTGIAAGCGGPAPGASVEHEEALAEAARALESRDDALRRARVWLPPEVPPGQADLANNPAGAFRADEAVACRFVVAEATGTTPKFNCELPGGEVVKVKYGAANAEIYAEVAASRLLSALGFGADRMSVVRRVRCAGCPRFPYLAMQCLAATGLQWPCVPGRLDESRVVDFDIAVVERRMEGREIEALPDQGWAWYELDRIDASAGGASRAEVDALRLMAMLLVHWDNKGDNQRLVCLPGGEAPGGGCSRPLAIIQDLGATFGPTKLDLRNWRHTPVWADARTCTVSMKSLPWGGGTFPDHRVSEEGRRLLLGLLEQLSDEQLAELFVASRVTAFDQVSAEARDPLAWVRAWGEKVEQIRSAGPC